MQTQPRDFGVGTQGDDVRLLQAELAALGSAVPGAESAARTFGPGTARALTALGNKHDWQLSNPLVVDTEIAALVMAAVGKSGRRHVEGTIRGTNGNQANSGGAMTGVRVRAFDRRIQNKDVILGEAISDSAGNYTICYESKRDDCGPPRKVMLVVRAFDANEQLVGESASICGAPPMVVLDLVLSIAAPEGPSESEQLMEALEPWLEGADPATLTPDDVALLACSSGQPEDRVALVVEATKLALRTDLPFQVFYALGRSGMTLDPVNLLARGPAARRSALAAACDANIIPRLFREKLDELAAALQQQLVSLVLAPSPNGPPMESPPCSAARVCPIRCTLISSLATTLTRGRSRTSGARSRRIPFTRRQGTSLRCSTHCSWPL